MTRTRVVLGISALLLVTGCARANESTTFQFETLNESGVTGTVTLTDLGARTLVEVAVEPAGHSDMPAHIHAGHCGHVVPQPSYPLENVRDGVSSTEIGARYEELVAQDQAVNLHRSNDDLETYTACAQLLP